MEGWRKEGRGSVEAFHGVRGISRHFKYSARIYATFGRGRGRGKANVLEKQIWVNGIQHFFMFTSVSVSGIGICLALLEWFAERYVSLSCDF